MASFARQVQRRGVSHHGGNERRAMLWLGRIYRAALRSPGGRVALSDGCSVQLVKNADGQTVALSLNDPHARTERWGRDFLFLCATVLHQHELRQNDAPR